MPYTPTTWVDTITDVSASNMNKLETGLAGALQRDEVEAAGVRLLAAKLLAGDAQNVFRIMGDGDIIWGAGGASAPDVNLYRPAANILASDDTIKSLVGSGSPGFDYNPATAVGHALRSLVGGEANPRFNIESDGKHNWGPGSGTITDTNLYRSAASVLKTDDQLHAVGGITTKTKSGVPTDSDTDLDADGTVIMDTTNHRLYVRSGGLWRYIPLGTSDPTAGIPAGSIFAYGGSSAPSGYLFCDGSLISRTTYASLFAAIGTAYDVGDGSTTFGVPDYRGRVVVGKGTHTDIDSLGDNDGVSTVADRRPKHKHTVNDPGHTHNIYYQNPVGGTDISLRNDTTRTNQSAQALSNTTGITVGPQTNSPTDGPAYGVANYIIKT